MSNPAKYSLFSELEDADAPIDLSWILKLVDQDDGDQENSSASSSPERRNGDANSSGYSSGGESAASRSTLIPEEMSDSTTSSHGSEADTVRPAWCDSPISMNNEPQVGSTLQVFTNHYVQQANQEAEFFLQVLSPTDIELEPPTNFLASVIHSSGFVQSVSLEKMESLPGYRCTFLPVVAGRYSASVYQDRLKFRRGIHSNIYGCPLDMLISRNYTFDSRSPVVENLYVKETGAKYWGIATDKFSDTLYVTDRETHEIIALHPDGGQPLFRFGQNPTPNVESLYRPTGIVCDSVNRRLIVCDKDNHRIVFLSLNGRFISAFGKKGHQNGEFNYPWDVDVSPSGDLIVVTDSRNHRIQIFDRFGNYLRKFSVFETLPFEYKLEFDYPRGVTFDLEGRNVYVTDFNTHNVLGLNVELTEYKKLIPPGKMCRPQGITVDDIGNLLVCDSRRNCIRVMTAGGDLLSTVESVGHSHLTVPADVTVMRGGEIAVVDIFGRIRLF